MVVVTGILVVVRLIWIMATKAPSGPSKEDTKDMTSDDSKVEPGIPGHDGVPVKGSDGDTTARIPELGCVDGKWTGGTDEMFNKGPNGDGKIPRGAHLVVAHHNQFNHHHHLPQSQ
jgi:hypothetical protein